MNRKLHFFQFISYFVSAHDKKKECTFDIS